MSEGDLLLSRDTYLGKTIPEDMKFHAEEIKEYRIPDAKKRTFGSRIMVTYGDDRLYQVAVDDVIFERQPRATKFFPEGSFYVGIPMATYTKLCEAFNMHGLPITGLKESDDSTYVWLKYYTKKDKPIQFLMRLQNGSTKVADSRVLIGAHPISATIIANFKFTCQVELDEDQDSGSYKLSPSIDKVYVKRQVMDVQVPGSEENRNTQLADDSSAVDDTILKQYNEMSIKVKPVAKK